jgi:hypothetical protein
MRIAVTRAALVRRTAGPVQTDLGPRFPRRLEILLTTAYSTVRASAWLRFVRRPPSAHTPVKRILSAVGTCRSGYFLAGTAGVETVGREGSGVVGLREGGVAGPRAPIAEGVNEHLPVSRWAWGRAKSGHGSKSGLLALGAAALHREWSVVAVLLLALGVPVVVSVICCNWSGVWARWVTAATKPPERTVDAHSCG